MVSDSHPPVVLDCAVVLAYAIHGEDVRYTGHISTFMDGVLVGPEISHSAICRNLSEPSDFLFLYCDPNWNVMAAAGYSTLVEAEECARKIFAGIENVITRTNYSDAEIDTGLHEYWNGVKCSICGRWPHQAKRFVEEGGIHLCDSCT